ncbi:hypothetical protein SRO_3055 [Streptomyces rochei]|nr:hypothetical protein SRO_3055 [Streptomyces rochei]
MPVFGAVGNAPSRASANALYKDIGHGWLTSGAVSKAHKIWGEQVQGLVGRLAQDELHTDEHAQDLPKNLVQPLAHIMTSWQTKSGTRQVHAGWYAGACLLVLALVGAVLYGGGAFGSGGGEESLDRACGGSLAQGGLSEALHASDFSAEEDGDGDYLAACRVRAQESGPVSSGTRAAPTRSWPHWTASTRRTRPWSPVVTCSARRTARA